MGKDDPIEGPQPSGIPVAQQGALGPVELPRDERVHDQPFEWWYFVGHIDTTSMPTRRLGFEFTVVRIDFGVLTGFYLYHALIDANAKSYLSTDRWNDGAYQETPLGFEFEFPSDGQQPGPLRLTATTHDGGPPLYVLDTIIRHDDEDRAMRLKLKAPPLLQRPPLLHGIDGVVDVGGVDMAYYARTRLAVEGGIKLHNRYHLVQGSAWLERQWGPIQLLDRRWKYFSIQLDDGRDATFVDILDRQSSARLRTPLAAVVTNHVKHASDAVITDDGSVWGPGYPLRHRITSPDLGVDLKVAPVFEAQRRVVTGQHPLPLLTFWEGICDVYEPSDTGVPTSIGRAFMELGGYE